MLISGNTKELLELVENINEIEKVNYGNVGKKDNSKKYTAQVFLTDDEIEDTKLILEKGIKIEMQSLPTTDNVELKADML